MTRRRVDGVSAVARARPLDVVAVAPSTHARGRAQDGPSRGGPDASRRAWIQRRGDAPSGWTCSSSALRFRVDTAGPLSSLTMVPRSPASGFVVTRRV